MATRQYKACLFDLDGLLINTEDIFTTVANTILADHGKGPLTWDVKINLQGRTSDDVSKLCCQIYDLPITAEQWKEKNFQRQSILWRDCQLLPGAKQLIKYLEENDVPFALSTSSTRFNYEIKASGLRDTFDLFQDRIITGDDSRIPPGKGKPFPHIYQLALKTLNDKLQAQGKEEIKPEEVLVFEDGLSGVQAGLAAGAYVIWVPHPEARKLMNGGEGKHIGDKGVVLDELTQFVPKDYGL